MNILVVEDERNLADAICRILSDAGYNAEACYDGRSGLVSAESGLYDAVILDVMLPGMDGFELVHELAVDGILMSAATVGAGGLGAALRRMCSYGTGVSADLSDVLRAPRGLARDHTMKIRAQSHNTTGDPNLQKKPSPLKTSRFDREFTAKSKILQMSRRGFPASAIATQLGVPQDQVEAVIREAMDAGN